MKQYRCLEYKYNAKNNSVEFVRGKLSDAVGFMGDLEFDKNPEPIPDVIANATSIKFDKNVDTSNITNMKGMFYCAPKLKYLDVSNLNTSNVTSMEDMFAGDEFYEAPLIKIKGLSNFNTSKVTNMSDMFFGDVKLVLADVSHFNTSNVTDMSEMFDQSGFPSINMSHWDTSNVTNMEQMFKDCDNLTSLDVSHLNTSDVTDMTFMFFSNINLKHIKGISNWNTSNVTRMDGMFSYCESLTKLDVSHFDTSNVNDMSQMFSEDINLQLLDLSSFNTSQITNISMYEMFNDTPRLKTLILGENFKINCNSKDMFESTFSWLSTKLTTITVKSHKTKIHGLPKMYRQLNKLDKNGHPYTSSTKTNPNIGTFTTIANPISKSKTGCYNGLKYRFNFNAGALTFTSGKLTWNGLHNRYPKDKIPFIGKCIYTIHFDTDVDKRVYRYYAPEGILLSKIKSIDFGHVLDKNKNIDVTDMFKGANSLVSIKNANSKVNTEFKKHLINLKYQHKIQQLKNEHDNAIEAL